MSCENVSFKPQEKNWGKCSCKLDDFFGDSKFLFTLPFGKLTQQWNITIFITIFNRIRILNPGPFSIAMLVYQGVNDSNKQTCFDTSSGWFATVSSIKSSNQSAPKTTCPKTTAPLAVRKTIRKMWVFWDSQRQPIPSASSIFQSSTKRHSFFCAYYTYQMFRKKPGPHQD